MTPRLLLATLALPLALLTACGDEGSSVAEDSASSAESGSPGASDTPTESPAAPETSAPAPSGPPCAEVWVDGQSLPRGYTGCVQDGSLVKADPLGCSSGQKIVRFEDRFWAYGGGPITETRGLMKDDEYAAEVAICRG